MLNYEYFMVDDKYVNTGLWLYIFGIYLFFNLCLTWQTLGVHLL